MIARLADGATIAQAQSDLSRVSAVLSQTYPETNKGWDAAVEPMHTSLVRDVRSITLLLFGAVAFVLLITARTSAACWSRERPGASASSPCAVRSAPAARASCGNWSPKA